MGAPTPILPKCKCGSFYKEGDEVEPWELERQVPLILGSDAGGIVRQVLAVVSGLVLVCLDNPSPCRPHVAFRLKSLEVEAEFSCCGPARPFLLE